MKKQLIILTLLLLGFNMVKAQDRIRPSKKYLPGDTIIAVTYGIILNIPDHWSGILNRDTEVFTLNCDTSNVVNVMIAPSELPMDQRLKNWNEDFAWSPGVISKPLAKAKMVGDILVGSFYYSNNQGIKSHAVSGCGDFGICYSILLTTPEEQHENFKNVLPELAKYISFVEPLYDDVYGDFNWVQELNNKYLFTYESGGGSTSGNHLWLCPDGSFRAELQRKGFLKGEVGDYKGKHKGTYYLQGVGPVATLKLDFKKLPDLELDLEIKDDIIYMNGIRYSMANSTKCK